MYTMVYVRVVEKARRILIPRKLEEKRKELVRSFASKVNLFRVA